tara:strand:+ start:172 stop:798 length:627 start_codon:yes stop_codon:yes gene_type:complete
MDKFTISIFGSKIFSEILEEINLFSKFQLKYYDDLDLCLKDVQKGNQLVVFFSKPSLGKIVMNNFPSILITKSLQQKSGNLNNLQVELKMPFKILDFEKKVISLFAKNQFKKNSIINLNGYIIDKNERKLKKNNLEIQLSEKEINFLILFSENKNPVSKNIVLKKVWKYSEKSETHTVETHIHRLRKKILEKFDDNNFIKNNNEGYYI